MDITLNKIKVRDVFKDYSDDDENGVKGYGGKLDIRPKYQREFVYKDKQRDEVIKTVKKKFPLNVMYWVKNGDDKFEILDGQQRTISLCAYIKGDFSIDNFYFHNLTQTEKDQIWDYELMIYFCEGTDKEKLEWFKIVNIAGEKLTPQELRNAVYTGEWLTDAKRYFSKTGCVASSIGSDYLKGSPTRQEYLEKALEWISNSKGISIEQYMARMQHKSNANELWLYFNNVITWVKTVFRTYRKEMKGLEWGLLYNKYKDNEYDSNQLEEKVKELMTDEEIQKRAGIYEYLLSNDEKHLNLRAFPQSMKRKAYEEQNKKCANSSCPSGDKEFEIDEMEGDHITPWSAGGKTVQDNCQMLCRECNRRKSAR